MTDSAREPHVVKIAGKTYCDKSMSRYDREEFAEPLTATSLNSLIDYISGKSEELRESMIIHVESPTKVRLLSGLTQERNREELFRVGTNPNGFDFDHYYDQEAFVINMQTAFKQSGETELILSVAGNVENKTVANYGDDGVSQKATNHKRYCRKRRCDRTKSSNTSPISYIFGSRTARKQVYLSNQRRFRWTANV